MKHREFVFEGSSIPEIDDIENADFILNYQKAVLLSLVKRNLLSLSQCERCLDILENQQIRSK